MEFIKLRHLEHSGQGKDATHIKVMRKFKKSITEGMDYCRARGWEVNLTDILLTVQSRAMVGFKMVATIKK